MESKQSEAHDRHVQRQARARESQDIKQMRISNVRWESVSDPWLASAWAKRPQRAVMCTSETKRAIANLQFDRHPELTTPLFVTHIPQKSPSPVCTSARSVSPRVRSSQFLSARERYLKDDGDDQRIPKKVVKREPSPAHKQRKSTGSLVQTKREPRGASTERKFIMPVEGDAGGAPTRRGSAAQGERAPRKDFKGTDFFADEIHKFTRNASCQSFSTPVERVSFQSIHQGTRAQPRQVSPQRLRNLTAGAPPPSTKLNHSSRGQRFGAFSALACSVKDPLEGFAEVPRKDTLRKSFNLRKLHGMIP